MRHIVKKICKTIAGVLVIGCCIGVISTMVMLYAGSDSIMDAYVAMTGDTNSRRENSKTIFLKHYISETGELSVLKLMGMTASNIRDIASSVTDLGSSGGGDGPGGGNPPGETQPPPKLDESSCIWELPAFYMQNAAPQSSWRIAGNRKTIKSVGCAAMTVTNMACWLQGKDIGSAKVKQVVSDASNFSGNDILWNNYMDACGGSGSISKNHAYSASSVINRLRNNQLTMFYYFGKTGYYKGTGHYAMVYGYETSASGVTTFYMADPAYGLVTITDSELRSGSVKCNYF